MTTELLSPTLPALAEPAIPAVVVDYGTVIPALILNEGARAAEGYINFFAAEIANDHTRRAYLQVIHQFDGWCARRGVTLRQLQPFIVAAYIKELPTLQRDRKTGALEPGRRSVPTVKQHLAALRKFFDFLVVRHVLASNPAAAVRGPRHSVRKGKTPILTNEEAAALLSGIDTAHVVGLRDRAIIGLMLYTWARVGALVRMRVRDYYRSGRTWRVRLHEKNGKVIDLPAHHNLVEYLAAYIEAAGIAEDEEGPLFRSAIGKTKRLTANPLNTVDVLRMMKRRAKQVGLPEHISPHSCRATGITNFIANGGRKDRAQEMAGHADARTTSLYDHSDNPITLDDVERINFSR